MIGSRRWAYQDNHEHSDDQCCDMGNDDDDDDDDGDSRRHPHNSLSYYKFQLHPLKSHHIINSGYFEPFPPFWHFWQLLHIVAL